MSDDPKPKPKKKHKTHKPELSAKEVRFCQELFNGTSRYEAFVAHFGTRETRTATDTAAWRLVKKRQIRDYLRDLQHAAAAAARVTVEELAALLAAFTRADIRRLMTPTGEFLPLDQWPDEVAIAVESIETDDILEPVPGRPGTKRLKGHTRKVKLVGKMSAASRLMEWKRMLGRDKADDDKSPEKLTIGEDK